MDNEVLCRQRSPPSERKSPLARRRDEDDEPDGLTFHVSLLWPGAGSSRRAWSVSRTGVYRFLKGAPSPAIARRRPRSDRPLFRMLTWPIISAGKSKRPTFTARLSQTMGATARCRGSLEPSPRAPGDGRERLAWHHRVRHNQEKAHDGTVVTGKVNEMWGRT